MRFGRGLARSAGGVWVRKPAAPNLGITLVSVAKSYGVVGTTIRATVTGNALPGSPSVTVNGVTADSITRISDTQVDFNIPSGTGQGAKSVVVEGSTLTNALTVAYFVEDWSGYTNIDNFITDPNGWYYTSEAGPNTDDWSFDDADFYTGSTRSFVYTWPARGAAACTGYSIRCVSRFGSSTPALADMWIEHPFKFSSGWTNAHPSGGCEDGEAYKWVLGGDLSWTVARWQTGFIGSGQYGVEWPTSTTTASNVAVTPPAGFAPSDLWDGEWHVLRIRRSHGASATLKHWIDGTVIDERTINTGNATATKTFQYGANINTGPEFSQTLKWGRSLVFSTDPGW